MLSQCLYFLPSYFFQLITTTSKQLPAFISANECAYSIFSPYPAAEGVKWLSKHLDLSQG